MIRVIIISYFFPPCNLTASQRVFSWAKYLNQFGIYPTIITRKWEKEISQLSDVSKSTSEGILYEETDAYEVYYLPYKSNFRDKLLLKSENKYKLFRRFLTFCELLLQLWFTKIVPFNNIYDFTKKILEENPSKFSGIIISGNPFIQFKFGYLLSKRFKIKWVADYRDAWTTSEINFINKNKIFSVLNSLERYFEKKWVSTASLVTASSSEIAEKISSLTHVQSIPIFNGFDHEELEKVVVNSTFEKFTITYVGTLYDGQRIELFCEAYKQFIDLHPSANIQLLFPGLSFYVSQSERIDRLLENYVNYYQTTTRIPRAEVLEIEKKSHLLLHVAWDLHEGIIASKIYEYIGSGTPVLVCPGDKGAIDSIVLASQSGVCLNHVSEIVEYLSQMYTDFQNGTAIQQNFNSFQFSRYVQTENLAGKLITAFKH